MRNKFSEGLLLEDSDEEEVASASNASPRAASIWGFQPNNNNNRSADVGSGGLAGYVNRQKRRDNKFQTKSLAVLDSYIGLNSDTLSAKYNLRR